MRVKSLLATLLLMVAGLQTAQAQGFRVYKTDGTIVQFSLRTDSIVFYNGIGSDVDFGPYTPVNQCIDGTWYKSETETVTFSENGATDYIEGATYKFFPYQGNIVFYNASKAPVNILRVYEVTADKMIVSPLDGSSISIWSRTKPVALVTSIVLSDESIFLQVNETKTLTATVEPSDADNPALTWESSNEEVATVSDAGLVTAVAEGACTITCSATDGSGVKAECQVTVEDSNHGYTDSHEWVDLGLPSGTLWATCNVGASSPEKYGKYFAWGETEPKSIYNWSTYKYCMGSEKTLTKYCDDSAYGYNSFMDNKTELDIEDDVAAVKWGRNWQMPSWDQMEELIDDSNTIITLTTQNGVVGKLITSKYNGKSIFLPAAGYRYESTLDYEGSIGYYWSHTLTHGSAARSLYFTSDMEGEGNWSGNRPCGRSVRPVRKK